jgi:hypothetical protein
MKIKINETLLGVDGVQPLQGEQGRNLTLKDICISSVLTPMQDDTQEQKFKKWEIFKRLRDADAIVELSAEEISIIKKAMGKLSPPLVMGQCFELLETN